MENPINSSEELKSFGFVVYGNLFTENWMKVEYRIREDLLEEYELELITNAVKRKLDEKHNRTN